MISKASPPVSISTAGKYRYLDASALLKLFVSESDCQPVRDFYLGNTNFCTTSMCLSEALGRLKGLWKKGRQGQSKLTIDEYFLATKHLIIAAWGKRIEIDDLSIFDPSIHAQVEQMAIKHKLDISDALQLITILKGRNSVLIGDSSSILITADRPLAIAAKAEQIRVWNCIAEPAPAWA